MFAKARRLRLLILVCNIAILNYLREASTTLSYRYTLAEHSRIDIRWLSVVEANILANHLELLRRSFDYAQLSVYAG